MSILFGLYDPQGVDDIGEVFFPLYSKDIKNVKNNGKDPHTLSSRLMVR